MVEQSGCKTNHKYSLEYHIHSDLYHKCTWQRSGFAVLADLLAELNFQAVEQGLQAAAFDLKQRVAAVELLSALLEIALTGLKDIADLDTAGLRLHLAGLAELNIGMKLCYSAAESAAGIEASIKGRMCILPSRIY